MIKSMTGFGISKVELPSGTMLCCDIKTLNHKYLDILISLPKKLKPYEPEIMKRLKNSFKRGRIETSFYIEPDKSSILKFDIDFQKAEEYYNLILSLKKRLDVKGDVDIALLSNLNDIFVKKDTMDISEDDMLMFLRKVLDDSIEKVKNMRIEEGKAIYNDFRKRLANLKEHLTIIKEGAAKNIPLCRERIKKSVDSIKGEININENRLEQEILLFALKSDIMEECIRLENHISQFKSSLEVEEDIGKKLNFLLQEMTREINTLCVKALSSDVKKSGVQIREVIEHLKEQVYNIE